MQHDINTAWNLVEKRANFLDRIMAMRDSKLEERANKDMVMSSIPLLGEAAQFVSDTQQYGTPTAVDRATYIQYHPAHFAAGPLAALIGAVTAPKLAKSPFVRKLYAPLNKALLGKGPHRMAPALGIGLSNAAALGLVGNYGARGLISRDYTLKRAHYKLAFGGNESEEKEKQMRTLVGLSPAVPLAASSLYKTQAPIYRDIDFVKKLGVDDAKDVNNRVVQELRRRNIVLASDRFEELRRANSGGIGASLGLNFGDTSPQKKNTSSRLGLLMRKMHAGPGAYMDIDSTLSKALASNIYTGKEIKQIKGMILGGASDSPLTDLLGSVKDLSRPPALHVLAHEMGHAVQPKWMKGMPARIGLKGPLAAVAAPVLSDNENVSLGAAGLGTAAALPGLIGEYDASRRGVGFLKNWLGNNNWAKMKGPSKLSPFIGLPTYLAAAAMPWMAYGTKKLLGGYEDNK